MKRLIAIATLTVASASQQAHAQDILSVTNPELCTWFAMTLISGESPNGIEQSTMVAELKKRGETCAPSDTYMQAAQYRLQYNASAKQRREDQDMNRQLLEEQRAQERRRRLVDAIRQFGETQKQKPVMTTRCNEFAGTVTCTSQ